MDPQLTDPILDTIADGVFTVDTDWRITTWNRAAQRITGFTRGEALGRRCSEIFRTIVSKSHRIQELLRVLPDIARADSTVLILGPSGSGKELFARAIHDQSRRAGRPFVALNCAALPDTLLESELFGHKAGAFTDAKRDQPGRFAAAQGGTIFLDEIGDISMALQVKLLRVLQEREYTPLGSSRSIKADVRVIAATNRDLRLLMAQGRFRDDLFYRLNVVRLDLPPLRERTEDIPLLTRHFIARFRAQTGRDVRDVTREALAALMRYDYPGNVRELENAVEHAFVLCHGTHIDLCCLPPEIAQTVGSEPHTVAPDAFEQAEAAVIRRALAENGGHRVRTAKALGIHKATLLRKMARFGVTWP